MKYTDKQCREMVAEMRIGKTARCFEVCDALEERLTPTVPEIIAHLEHVSREMAGCGEDQERKIYALAATLISNAYPHKV